MKHYLSYVEDVIKNRWELPAITNYGNNSLKNCDIARNIERLHILFEQCGIKVGDNVAICARNSAEWCVAFLAIATYKAVAVPLLADFLPENIANLVKISDSRMLFVDKSVLLGLQRAGVASGFGNYDDFAGVYDIVTYEAIEDCNNSVKVNIEDVDKAYLQKFPNGMSANDERLFSSSSLSAIRVISSAYLRLLLILPAILIPACDSFIQAFCMMYLYVN